MSLKDISELVLGYETNPEHGVKFKTLQLTGSITKTRRRSVRRSIDAANSILDTFAYTSTRSYGLFLLSFGLLSFLVHAIKNYTLGEPLPLYVIISSVIIALFGIPLVCFDKQFAIALQDFPLTDAIFFEFFCLKRMHRIDPNLRRADGKSVRLIKPYVALIFGLLFAAFTAILPMWTIMLGIGSFAYVFLTLVSPEFSFFATILVMPYLSLFSFADFLLAALVGLTFISFVVKVALGKRVFCLEQYDILLALFLLFVLISGIFVKGIASFGASLIIILFAMGYVLASSLISNRRIADCVVNAVIMSALPVSVYAVVLGVISFAENGWRSFAPVSATFETPDSLAVYLLVASVFAAYYAQARRRPAEKAVYSFIFTVIFVALLATASIWALVAGLFGVFAYVATKMKRGGPAVVGLLSLLPSVLIFLGRDLLAKLDKFPMMSSFNLPELAEQWDASFRMLLENLWVGVGIGSESFKSEIALYSDKIYTDSSNLILEIGCEAGVFALFAFILMIFARLFHRVAYRRHVAGSEVKLLCSFSSVAMCVLLAFGAVNYLWSDLHLNFLFWCVFGIGGASLRVAKREHDDRIGYFADGRSFDSSSIDVDIE